MYYSVDRSNILLIHPEIQISAHVSRKTRAIQRHVETYVCDVIRQTWETAMCILKGTDRKHYASGQSRLV